MNRRLSALGLYNPLVLITVLYLLAATGFNVITPLFEAPDESLHFFTAQYIAESGELPDIAKDPEAYDEWLGQEAAQPPLYYLLSALAISPINTAGAREQVWFNPFVWIGNAAALVNVNRAVHTSLEAWPWKGYALASHLLRGMSTLLGLGTVLCVYGVGRLLWPSDPQKALLATALVAFLPQFGFIHGAVNNDSLITFLSSAAIWQLIRLWQTHTSWQRLLLLGITIGLAALSKNTGVLLFLFAVGVLLLMALRDSRYRLIMNTIVLVVLPVLLIAGWLWWRNWSLYDDFTATNQFVRLAGGNRDYSFRQVMAEMRGLWDSLIAIFGWFNVRAPEWVYLVWNGVALLAIIGALKALIGGLGSRLTQIRIAGLRASMPSIKGGWVPGAILFFWFLAVFAGLVLFMMQTAAAQGRLLFPALVSLIMGAVYGLSQFKSRAIYWLVPLIALATTVFSIFFVIEPVYTQPHKVTELPIDATPFNHEMGQGLRLVGASLQSGALEPGEAAWITLYWQADEMPHNAPEFILELFGRDLQRISHIHSYHGRGLYPANLWSRDSIVADRFAFRVSEQVETPVLAWVQIRLFGEEAKLNVGTVKIVPADWPASADSALARLGEGIELVAASLSQDSAHPGVVVELAVTWRVTAVPEGNFTTLVHLGEREKPPIVTGDSVPLNGTYPTIAWGVNELFEDRYSLVLPIDLSPGRYPIWIGMYDPTDAARLPLIVDGKRQLNDVFLVDLIDIEER